MPVIRNEDQLRINPYNSTFTISTPSDERAQLYLKLPGIRINDADHPVMAYVPGPDNAVRGVIYGALGDESAEEIIELYTIEDPKLQILSARRMGQSRAVVVTFASRKLPRIVKFQYDDDEDEKDYRDHSVKKEKSRSHRSRTRRRSASRGHSSSRSRDRSASFPPLEEMKKAGSNQSGGTCGKSNRKTSNSHDNKKSEKTSRSRSSSSSRKADKQTTEHGGGRAILHRTGTATELRALDGQRSLPPEVRSKIMANTIPKHMSHELHEERRKARVDRERRQFKGDPNVTYVDVAAYPAGGLFAVAVVNGRDNSLTLAASVRAETPAAAETIAAALVIKQHDRGNRSSEAFIQGCQGWDDDEHREAENAVKCRADKVSTFKGATAKFKRKFLNVEFGFSCAVCDPLWFRGDLWRISAVQNAAKKSSALDVLARALPGQAVSAFEVCGP
ncbi:hypothetical protein HPB49_001949 [Dermacentor silvarum]|uniref:Uncharacterized protein n=1 Tax=Dermacentor silvarum TaxID=543639 RepID=A0ACB8DMB3_DERSI|nr:hypothetical protein HPB49_001949 [Dermacentor silvarum]